MATPYVALDPALTHTVTGAVSAVLPTAGKSAQFTVAASGTAVQLNGGTSQVCVSGLWIFCDADSPGYLCVGWATGNLTAVGVKINPGQAIFLVINNVNLLWVDASANSSKGSWLAT